jgi:tetratricopeptide (TPR) repeat protein
MSAEVDARCMLARVAIRGHNLEEGSRHAERARAAAHRAGEPGLEQMPLHILAGTARLSGDLPAARMLAAAAIAVHRSLGDWRMLAVEQHNLAHLELNAGNVERARGLFAAAREQITKVDDDDMLPELALGIAAVNTMDGEYVRAARIMGAVAQALDAANRVLDPDDAVEQETIRGKLVDVLGTPVFEAEYKCGSGLDLGEALERGVSHGS